MKIKWKNTKKKKKKRSYKPRLLLVFGYNYCYYSTLINHLDMLAVLKLVLK